MQAATVPWEEAMRILIAENEREIRQMKSAWLKKLGHEVITVEDGAQAIQILRGGVRFDAAVLDLIMPKLWGDDVLALVRRDNDLCHLPIVVVAGHDYSKPIEAQGGIFVDKANLDALQRVLDRIARESKLH